MNGLRTVWREEVNFRIEIVVAMTVVIFGTYLNFSMLEWVILAGCIGAVLSAEMVNTAIEDLCNKVEPKTDPAIKKVKDVMGGFVLVVCLTAVAIGMFIFSNYL